MVQPHLLIHGNIKMQSAFLRRTSQKELRIDDNRHQPMHLSPLHPEHRPLEPHPLKALPIRAIDLLCTWKEVVEDRMNRIFKKA